LRGLTPSGTKPIELAEEPIRICTLIDENAFNEDHLLIHHKTVYLEDRMHDWNWQNGKLRYYARMGGARDVVAIYEEQEFTPKMNFDPMTGAKL
jgi:hypothetical protein